MVTWAFGHLIQLAMPEAYGVSNFRRESLPILPPDCQLIPRQGKAEKGYKADPLSLIHIYREVGIAGRQHSGGYVFHAPARKGFQHTPGYQFVNRPFPS